MLRQFHKFPGLIAALLLIVIALSGTVMALQPALDHLKIIGTRDQNVSVAQMAQTISQSYPAVTQITRKPSGQVIVYYTKDNNPVSAIVDPATGQKIGDYAPSAFFRWMRDFHRSLFMGNNGRIATAISAAAMLVLCISGIFLMVRRLGGWGNFFGKPRGTLAQRLHVVVGRIVVPALVISALTAIYISLVTFQVVPDGSDNMAAYPTTTSGGTPQPVGSLIALRNVAVDELQQLTFPYPDDPSGLYSIKTDHGNGYIDPANGKMLSWAPNTTAQDIYQLVLMLHTGRGLWWLGLILGLGALGVPAMAASGTLVWLRRRRAQPKIAHNASVHHADTVIFVGSEGNTTWGFAQTLHDALRKEGHKVHTTSMNRFGPRHGHARNMFFLTATYGNGDAPETAKRFFKRLEKISTRPQSKIAVLGFGDRQFPQFCQFGRDVQSALENRGFDPMLPFDTIDRQSSQEFARWGHAVGAALGTDLALAHTVQKPRTFDLVLQDRIDYGLDVQAPTTVLRFVRGSANPRNTRRFWPFAKPCLPKCNVGDLIGIVPPGSPIPRYYSLASGSRDDVIEICVRHHPGGLCSSFLHGLEPGDGIEAFVKTNPDFRPAAGKAPVILIGAGTGVGPLAGFIRSNHGLRPMHLYFGCRHPQSDFLYQSDLSTCLEDQRLHSLTTAFSRTSTPRYIQDYLRQDAAALRDLITKEAQIMVCGGREMAQGVMDALEEVLRPLGLHPAQLKAEGRYVEDVY